MSYPGRRLYLEFSTDHLAGMLPELIDASDQPRLAEKIADYYRMTEPNAFGVPVPEDDFEVALQLAIYIIRRLEKIARWVNKRLELGQPVEAYTEQDLESE